VNAEFVAAMEDVLDLYEEPYDPTRPKVNFDETSKQLIAKSRAIKGRGGKSGGRAVKAVGLTSGGLCRVLATGLRSS